MTAEAAAPTAPVPVGHQDFESNGTEVARSALVGEAQVSLRAPVVDLARRSPDLPTRSDEDLEPAAAPEGSTKAWTEHYLVLTRAELEDELEAALGAGVEANRQVGYVKAALTRGPELSRQAVLRAAALPTAGDARGVSVGAFAVQALIEVAEEPGMRPVLEELAFGPTEGVPARLRGRAAAALVEGAELRHHRALHDQLYRERDPHVLASAFGAARGGDRALKLALADLEPSLASCPDLPDGLDLAQLERLEL